MTEKPTPQQWGSQGPCWSHPALGVSHQLHLLTPKAWTSIAEDTGASLELEGDGVGLIVNRGGTWHQ